MINATRFILTLVLIAIIISVSAFAADAEPGSVTVLGITALAPMMTSPLAKMDLLPQPDPAAIPAAFGQARSLGYAVPDFNPRSVVSRYTPPIFGREIGASSLGDKLFTVSLFSAIALNVADYFSTLEALKRPGLQEGNTLMKTIVKSPAAFAAVKIGVCAFTYCGLKNLYKSKKPLAWVISTATNVAMSYVVSNNLRLINRHPRAI